jgi:hypothetical protein
MTKHLVTPERSVRVLILAFERGVCYTAAKIWPGSAKEFDYSANILPDEDKSRRPSNLQDHPPLHSHPDAGSARDKALPQICMFNALGNRTMVHLVLHSS